MEPVHLHLLTNHVAVIGAFFGALVLVVGMLRKSPPTLAAAYWVFVVSAVLAIVAYFTGEGAEDAVRNLPGVTHDIVESHEDMGKFVLISMIVLGALSVIGLIRSHNHYDKIKGLAMISLIVALIGFGIGAYTAYTGGLVRHTEIRPGAASPVEPKGEHVDND